jgi:hypothetical protein
LLFLFSDPPSFQPFSFNLQSSVADPDPHQREKQDPDPHHSEELEALEGHFGALEGLNLEDPHQVKNRIRIRINVMRIRNNAAKDILRFFCVDTTYPISVLEAMMDHW